MLQYAFDDSTASALVSEGLITQDQLSRARKLQEHLAGQKTVADVLIELNIISDQRLQDFLRRHRSRQSLSDILIGRGLITERDVLNAREIQRKRGSQAKRIGETLIEMGLIEERHVVEALADKFGFPLLDPDITLIDVELIRKVSLK